MKTTDTDMRRAITLRALLAADGGDVPADVVVTDLTLDSRAARPGCAFIALRGARTHGVTFAEQACLNGARAVLWEPAPGVTAPRLSSNVCVLAIADLRSKLGAIADRFFGSPSAALRIAGVTGTNGKTTTAYIVAAALERLGEPSGYSGTLGHGRLGVLQPGVHTTADCITVHRQLAELRDAGARSLAMEVTSHALDQRRVDGVRFDTAVFTNLTRDHLDYHGTLEAYGAAKARLFAQSGLRRGVINVDDPFGRELAAGVQGVALTRCSRAAASFRAGEENALFATRVAQGPHGLEIDVAGGFGAATVRSRFIGDFNVDNVLAALATLVGFGVPLPQAAAALEQCSAPPGRMELIAACGRPTAVVDYAHTPDALEKALVALRAHCSGQLICVFGCGGERDPGKRPLMGGVAERLADRVIVTDDNPRGEDGDAIVADILRGLAHPERALVERDRAAAINLAIRAAREGDVVLIAGKGHEDYQIVGLERRRFDDREVARAALEGRS